jgi:acetyl-CoA C-acetyltransferase
MESGVFTPEVIGVAGVLHDERPRAGFSPERLARFPAAFREGGTVTAANSCGVNDAGAAIMLVPGATHDESDGPGLRLLSWASAGVEPSTPGLGLVPAASKALERAGLTWTDIDVIEFNEAFAAQILTCCDELGIDEERVCRQGGAIALGHPWGASGAVLMVRLFTQIALQENGRFGLAAIAGGGGQGTAVVVERCP